MVMHLLCVRFFTFFVLWSVAMRTPNRVVTLALCAAAIVQSARKKAEKASREALEVA